MQMASLHRAGFHQAPNCSRLPRGYPEVIPPGYDLRPLLPARGVDRSVKPALPLSLPLLSLLCASLWNPLIRVLHLICR